MCTRFFIELSNEALQDILESAKDSALRMRFTALNRPLKTSGEIRPTDVVPVIAPDRQGKRAVFPMYWGFTLPERKQPIVNARCETAATLPTFRESWKSRRCIIPASYYFEWSHKKTPDGKTVTGDRYLIQPEGSRLTFLCGLYRIEDRLPRFVVLTRPPSEALSQLHDRMPLILPGERIDEWIHPEGDPEALLPYALTDMFFEKAI
ncbi:MAG: SOS response-associated peptidase [Lachnospiraceae bacterium]|nr:SOS response-associated peptidase [Lachnospiraceae bacterium]